MLDGVVVREPIIIQLKINKQFKEYCHSTKSMRIMFVFTSLVLMLSMFSGCLGEADDGTYAESGFITEGWIPHPENNGTKDHYGIPILHTFTVDDGERVSVQSAVVTLNYSETDEDNVPRISNDDMIFSINCEDGTEFVSQMANPLPSGEGECVYTVTNSERWFSEEYEIHSVSWSLTYTIN